MRLIITVVSFKNFLKIGTQWTSSKHNKLFKRLKIYTDVVRANAIISMAFKYE